MGGSGKCTRLVRGISFGCVGHVLFWGGSDVPTLVFVEVPTVDLSLRTRERTESKGTTGS